MDWKPIDTAPKDGEPILLWLPEPLETRGQDFGPMSSHVTVGAWGGDPNTTLHYANGRIEPHIGWFSMVTGTVPSYGDYEDANHRVSPTHWAPITGPSD